MGNYFHQHAAAPGVLFTLHKKNPEDVATSITEETYTPRKAASVLGTEPATVKRLVDDGVLSESDDEAGAIDGDDLAQFIGELEPTTVRPDNTTPPTRTAAQTAPRGRGAKILKLAEPESYDLDCPSCHQPLTVDSAIQRFNCPSCDATLEVQDAQPSKVNRPNPPAAPDRRFLGIGRNGR